MSSIATAPTGARAFDRFASGFGRVAVVLSMLALLVAVAMSLPSSWFSFGGDEDNAPPSYTALEPASPVRLLANGLGLATPLVESRTDPRTALTTPPVDAPLASWWSASAPPGAEHGQTVLTAHATQDGGALSAISKLDRGDFVDLLTTNGTMRYEVAAVRTFDPARIDRAGAALFGQDGGAGRLVMVSAGAWDGVAYQSSVVVTATPLGQPAT